MADARMPFHTVPIPDLDRLPEDRRRAVAERVVAAESLARIWRRHALFRRGLLGLLIAGAAAGFGSRWLGLDNESLMVVFWALQAVMLVAVAGFVGSVLLWRWETARELRRLVREELERAGAETG